LPNEGLTIDHFEHPEKSCSSCLCRISLLFTIEKLGGEFNGRDHTRMIGPALPGDVERRAVVYGSANERKTQRDVDRFAE
jgi:hypothetical protein